MKDLWEVGEFVRKIRARMRFGELSRAPLRLLRLELRAIRRDAIGWRVRLMCGQVRCLGIFGIATLRCRRFRMRWLCARCFSRPCSDVQSADFRAFRQEAREPPRLVIYGTVTREMPAVPRVTSPVMRAKLCGFHFQMDDGVLEPLETEESGVQFRLARDLQGRGGSFYGSK